MCVWHVQVLFCSLTGEQRDLYRAYLSSEEVQDILNVSPNPFPPQHLFCCLLYLLPLQQTEILQIAGGCLSAMSQTPGLQGCLSAMSWRPGCLTAMP